MLRIGNFCLLVIYIFDIINNIFKNSKIIPPHITFGHAQEVEQEKEKQLNKVVQKLRDDVRAILYKISTKDVQYACMELDMMKNFIKPSVEIVMRELRENGFEAEIRREEERDNYQISYVNKLYVSIPSQKN